MTVPYRVESIKDNQVVGFVNDVKKEFKLDVFEGELEKGDYFLAQNGYVVQKLSQQDAANLMKLFN